MNAHAIYFYKFEKQQQLKIQHEGDIDAEDKNQSSGGQTI